MIRTIGPLESTNIQSSFKNNFLFKARFRRDLWKLIATRIFHTMNRLFVISILSILCISALGQEKVTWTGRAVDSQTNQPIPGANIWSSELGKGGYSRKDGSFEIKFQMKNSFSFNVTSIGYKPMTISSSDLKALWDGVVIELDVSLDFNVNLLGGPTITFEPDTVWGSKEYHVSDFCFTQQGMLLLTFEKEDRWKRQEDAGLTLLKNCQLVLLDGLSRELDSLKITDLALGFYTDYLDEIFLRCDEKDYHVSLENDEISLEYISKEDFNESIKPVRDSIGDNVFVSSYNPDYPAFEYFIFNQVDSTYHTMRYIVDQPLMELFRSEYKYLSGRGKLEAFRYELKTGIDKEIVAAYMSGFTNGLYFEPIYAPFFVVNDTAIIFDHYEDRMYKYSDTNQVLDSISIDYHKTKKRHEWQKRMVQDDDTHEIYGNFKRNGWNYLKRVDLNSGEVDLTFKLYHKYTDNIKVKDGWAYYVYRPFESSQKIFLYKEQILDNGVVKKS